LRDLGIEGIRNSWVFSTEVFCQKKGKFLRILIL
jgi:hypothetical protein